MASRRIREIDVDIESLDADGLGLATYEDRAVRVRNALPGERVHVRVLKRRGGIWYAQAESPEIVAMDRQTPPPCPFFPRCGGCALQHLAYDAQLKHKQGRLLDVLEQVGVRPQRVCLPVTGPRLHYRYKARLGARLVGSQLLVGFRESFSSRVTRMDDCQTLALPFAQSLPQLQEALSGLQEPQLVPQVELAAGDTEFAYIVRHLRPLTESDRSRLLRFARESGGRLYLQPGGYDSVHPLDPCDGPDYLGYSNLDFGLRFQFRPTDFTQVNPYINRSLVRSAVLALDPRPGATAADLFCGIGNFSLALARLGVDVSGYESASASIERAWLNASLNGLTDAARFRVVDLYQTEGESLPEADFLLLDPPRSGAGPNLRHWASWQRLERIAYVSCNPDTFAEDARLLQQMGFDLKEVGIYDMFPHTAHVETLGVFPEALLMVKAREEVPRLQDGLVDAIAWTQLLTGNHRHLDAERVLGACAFVRSLPHRGEIYLENGIELAELVADLEMDTSSVVAALAYRPVRAEEVNIPEMETVFGSDVAKLLQDVASMATTSILEMTNTRLQTSERRDQVESVRHMLISLINDARVAVLKLAERVVALRAAKNSSEDRKQRIAREAHLIFAPLANRLGVWQLKWELEDLSLRYLVPDVYVAIAKQLDGRRAERERRVAEIVEALKERLRSQGVEATVTGRAKHIYSIWRKMQTKNVGIDQVHDVRAVRVLVDTVAQCYAALGVIHTQWRHIPSEFDDYIAAPKENGYRSIHTAVLGPDGLTLEVQIRTREMHQESELGVCAHWAYKENHSEDRPFAEKLDWLRQVVELGEESLSATYGHQDFAAELQQLFEEERIFVYTPAGHVIDLTSGATPLDFAYRVHTEVGHGCTGALVDGRPVALNSRLETGQQVEILTAEQGVPQRSWLEPQRGFVHTSRARQKIHEWFRSRDVDVNLDEGRALVAEVLGDLGVAAPPSLIWQNAARELAFPGVPDMLAAVGAADLPVVDVIDLLFAEKLESPQLSLIPEPELAAPTTCRLEVRSPDRDGLLLDIVTLLTEKEVPLLANWGRVDRESGCAIITLQIPFPGLRSLAGILDQLKCVKGVTQARRMP